MRSAVTEDFRTLLYALPPTIQQQARDAYRIFKVNPAYPGLRYHRVTVKKSGKELHSVSIGIHYRALGREKNGILEWFWIGYHTIYDQLLAGR